MNAKFIVGIDLGGTNLKIAILDLKYNILEKKVLNTKKYGKKEHLILAIINSITSFFKNNNLKKKDILGIGIGLPGPVDNKRGIVHFLPNVPGWRKVYLKKVLEHKLNLPVFLDNDAKLMTIAEYKLGKAKGFKNVLCLTLGTGVGSGVILNRKLYRGEDNASGEIGHMPINERGERCNCGGIACLEAYIGNNKILREARQLFKRNISLEELSAKAFEHNKLALNIWQKVGRRLGTALVGVVNLLNLDAVVIGGGVANAGTILLDKVKETVNRQSMRVQARRVKIFKARLGNDAGLIGAAILVKEQKLE
jgi:glucokinase